MWKFRQNTYSELIEGTYWTDEVVSEGGVYEMPGEKGWQARALVDNKSRTEVKEFTWDELKEAMSWVENQLEEISASLEKKPTYSTYRNHNQKGQCTAFSVAADSGKDLLEGVAEGLLKLLEENPDTSILTIGSARSVLKAVRDE